MGWVRSRRWYVIAFLAGALFVVGVATAQWLASGTGSGYAKSGTAVSVSTADVSGTVTGDLLPGGTGDLTLSIANPNDYDVTVTDVVFGKKAITSDTAGCDSTNHGVTLTSQSGLSLTVPAGSTGTVHVLDGVVAMASTSADACQGATFTIPVALSGTSGTGPTSGGGTTTFIYYVDADADTFGDDQDSGTAFTEDTPPAGYSVNNEDCDDSDPGVYPGAVEFSDDGIDSNCDGADNT